MPQMHLLHPYVLLKRSAYRCSSQRNVCITCLFALYVRAYSLYQNVSGDLSCFLLHFLLLPMTKEEFLISRDFYLSNEEEQSHPYVAPSLTSDMHGLSPTLIITAECDPVRDSGEYYGQRLQEAGIPTTISRYDGMVHGFMGMRTLVPQADQALAEVSTPYEPHSL